MKINNISIILSFIIFAYLVTAAPIVQPSNFKAKSITRKDNLGEKINDNETADISDETGINENELFEEELGSDDDDVSDDDEDVVQKEVKRRNNIDVPIKLASSSNLPCDIGKLVSSGKNLTFNDKVKRNP